MNHRTSFGDPRLKEMYSLYLRESVDIKGGDLDLLKDKAKELGIRVIIGVAERVNHSIYCAAVHIDPKGEIINVHRKLMPSFGERLVWSIGDGHGLRAFDAEKNFKISALNCWENWLPLARASLYGQGNICARQGREEGSIPLKNFVPLSHERKYSIQTKPPVTLV